MLPERPRMMALKMTMVMPEDTCASSEGKPSEMLERTTDARRPVRVRRKPLLFLSQ